MRVLLALPLLLSLTASAYAECAWVLWEEKEDYNAVQNYLDKSWTVLRTYPGLADCKTDQAKLLSGETSSAPPDRGSRVRLDDGFYSIFRNDAGRTVRNVKQRALCVPDSIDPRGPKGK
jgi:hypothetical protein